MSSSFDQRAPEEADDVAVLPPQNSNNKEDHQQQVNEEEIASPKILVGPVEGVISSSNTLPKESQIIHHRPKGSVPESTGIWKTLDE